MPSCLPAPAGACPTAGWWAQWVPGAGIYYTAYYFIQGSNALALAHGISTFKIAVALAVGISLVLSIPLPKKKP